jgi:hypothetical protein
MKQLLCQGLNVGHDSQSGSFGGILTSLRRKRRPANFLYFSKAFNLWHAGCQAILGEMQSAANARQLHLAGAMRITFTPTH